MTIIGGDGDDNTRGIGDIVCVLAICYTCIIYLISRGNCIRKNIYVCMYKYITY